MLSDTSRPCLFVFAHPDDEFAVFGWLRRFVLERRDVHCLWLTDGGWGGQSTQRRRKESIRVLSDMGVLEEKMWFLGEQIGVRDGELLHNLGKVLPAIEAWALEMALPPLVFVPAWEGGHHDHDATHLAGHALARARAADVFQFSLYHGYERKGPWFQVLAPLRFNGEQYSIRVSLAERLGHIFRCLRFTSQWKSFAGLLPFYTLRMMHRAPFVLQVAQWSRTAERPHPGALLYERRGGPHWQDFADATAPYRCRD